MLVTPTKRTRKGFTLVELIVVIAIIVILALVVIPVVGLLGGGKSLAMTGNAVDAYIANLRSKALTSQRSIIVVIFPHSAEGEAGNPIKFRLADGKSDGEKPISSGFVAFEVRKESDFIDPKTASATELFVYLNNDLNFDEELDDEITIHSQKLTRWASNKVLAQSIEGYSSKLEEVGIIPKTGEFFLFVIRPDGRVDIPYDVPVTQLDEEASQRDGDIVFTDGNQSLFIDISRYAKVTSRPYRVEALEGSSYKPEERE